MAAKTIIYELTLSDGPTWRFEVNPDQDWTGNHHNGPDWALLTNKQCPNCPLSAEHHRWCPPAVALAQIIPNFEDMPSVTRVHARVISDQRVVSQDTDLQTALRSLIGLVMPTSGCPILGRLGGLARFHLPFADRDETVFRVVGGYLVSQYLNLVDGHPADWHLNGVRALYEEVKRVDMAFADRVRDASQSDASVNAVIALFSLAALVSLSLDDDLQRIRGKLEPGRE